MKRACGHTEEVQLYGPNKDWKKKIIDELKMQGISEEYAHAYVDMGATSICEIFY